MIKFLKTILMNQLRIMSAMQRLEYFIHQESFIEDLGEGIKETQKILDDNILDDIDKNTKESIGGSNESI